MKGKKEVPKRGTSFLVIIMKFIAIDNETKLIERTVPFPKVIVTGIYDGKNPCELVKWDNNLRYIMRELLLDPEIGFVGHNIAYDFGTLAATFSELLPLIFDAYRADRVTDTGIRQQIYDIATGRTFADDKVLAYSLDRLVMDVLDGKMEGKKGPDVWRLRYAELEHVPVEEWPEAAVSYAKGDPVATYDVFVEQKKGEDQIFGEFAMARNFFCLALMQARGMRTDPEAVSKFRRIHTNTMDRLIPELVKAKLLQKKKDGWVKKRKPAQARILAACEAKGVEPRLTDTGKKVKREGGEFQLSHVAIDKAACLIAGDELMLKRAEYGTAEKMMSTYYPTVLAGTDGPVTTRFNMAATGRTTSSAPSEPLIGTNFQNPPRKGGLRECYVPRKGYVFLDADFGGAELHTLAQTCLDILGFSTLGDRLNAGEDPHADLGARILGVSEAEFLELLQAKDEGAKNARQDAKAGNFGFPGGMFERTFMETQLKQREKFWTFKDTRTLRNNWLASLPEMEEYFDYCKRELGPQEMCQTVINRYGMIRAVSRFPQMANTLFQAPAAAGALDALSQVTYESYVDKSSPLYGYRPCNYVHDQIIGELPITTPDRMDAAARRLEKVMCEEFNKTCPDYPISAEPVMMAYWAKDAEQVFDSEGRLTVWGM